MAGSVFVLRYESDARQFAEAFLASADFEMNVLKQVLRNFGTSVRAQSKSDLINLISQYLRGDYESSPYLSVITKQLVARPKDAIAVKTGPVSSFPVLNDANDLIISAGKEEWYGPVICPNDEQTAHWYIRPQFVDYWEVLPGEVLPKQLQARWLCFARVTPAALSLHWRGFTYPNGPDAVQSNAKRVQFPYWASIPQFFDEIQDLTNAQLEYVDLHDLLLHHLWDKYLEDHSYKWTHTRIRAESSGVSLNAHAGVSDNELNVGGILHLARTVRVAVEKDLATKGYLMEFPEHIDNIILRTLIREYGALSYGFSLASWGELVFKAHSYFGLKPASKSPDSFPHMQVTYSEKDALDQLHFILMHAQDMHTYGDSEPHNLRMF